MSYRSQNQIFGFDFCSSFANKNRARPVLSIQVWKSYNSFLINKKIILKTMEKKLEKNLK
jgi:hypothetical protein